MSWSLSFGYRRVIDQPRTVAVPGTALADDEQHNEHYADEDEDDVAEVGDSRSEPAAG